MNISVLIIAHNEEKHIAQCIESVLHQTKKADEVVLIVHNCTDHTEDIARNYHITVISYTGPKGIIYARLEGIKHVTGDIILCTDGDSYVARNWIEVMSSLLTEGNILVASWMKMKGTFFGWVSNFFNRYYCGKKNLKHSERWIWGPSMGFWNKDKKFVAYIFQKSISLQQEAGLTRNPDDYWLALFMKQYGTLAITNKTHVTQHTKETSTIEVLRRNRENMSNAKKMDDYLVTNPFS